MEDKQFEAEMTELMQKHEKPRFGRKLRWFVYFLIALSILFIYLVQGVSTRIMGFQPPEMAMARYTPKDVIGDLGGMKVRIPRHYAKYVEYDGDPGFGRKRKGPRPKRTFDSRLSGFGMDVRFPDMKGLENAQLWEEKRRQPLQEKTWIYVWVNAGETYPGDGFLDRRTNSSLFNADPSKMKGHWLFTYERMPEDEYELEVWRLSGTDPRTGMPARESHTTNDIYIHRDSSGNVDVYISCGRPRVPSGIGSCNLATSLVPKSQVEVNVMFRRGLLPEWKRIQQSVRELLLSFEVEPSSLSLASSEPSLSTHTQTSR